MHIQFSFLNSFLERSEANLSEFERSELEINDIISSVKMTGFSK